MMEIRMHCTAMKYSLGSMQNEHIKKSERERREEVEKSRENRGLHKRDRSTMTRNIQS
jgi:hypothetical protein